MGYLINAPSLPLNYIKLLVGIKRYYLYVVVVAMLFVDACFIIIIFFFHASHLSLVTEGYFFFFLSCLEKMEGGEKNFSSTVTLIFRQIYLRLY